MRVKVIKRYNDMVLHKIQEVDTEFETEEKRAEHLVEEGVAEILKKPASKVSKENEG